MNRLRIGEHRIVVLRQGGRWVARVDGHALPRSHPTRQDAEDAGLIEAVVLDAERRADDRGRRGTAGPPSRRPRR